MFRALLLQKNESFQASLASLDESALPAGDVTLDVAYSTLNFKDGLAICNKSPVVRQWPMVAGIDGAGTVTESSHPMWKVGDQVVLNGWGVGETHWGCLAEKARLKGDWLVRLPATFTLRQAMAIGTAGYTAMLCVMALERHGVQAGQGDVLVTGASGGVGSVAVALLSALGHRVVASTGKAAEHDYLKRLGAAEVIDRASLSEPGKLFQKERWTAVVDSVGSQTLANSLAQTRYGGAVAACGLAQGMDLPTTVMPFILRNVALLGVDSVMAPLALRQQAWDRLARDLKVNLLEEMIDEIGLDQAQVKAADLMAGRVRGRVVVKI
ncbi:MAG: MDR family oxidoreductase [Alphaproteobacteria bacterium]|nr:MDR family oxidoreductase [Alphaproteobacteria bacterium]